MRSGLSGIIPAFLKKSDVITGYYRVDPLGWNKPMLYPDPLLFPR